MRLEESKLLKRLAFCFALVFAVGTGVSSVAPSITANAAAPVLDKGDREGYVWGLQNRLLQLGIYEGRVDGKFGPLTKQAVKEFQSNYNLPKDGVVGSQTWKTLRNQTFTSDEIQLLAQLVHAEAKGESLKGKVAVAAVALNRIDSNKFPDTVKGVIYEPLAFSPVQDGSFYNPPDKDAYRAVYLATKGWDPTHNSLYFFNPAKAESDWIWTRPQTTQIGKHVFAK